MEKAFSRSYVLAERLGHVPDAAEIAGMAEDDLLAVFSKPPALHRVPGSMAKRVQAMCAAVAEQYDNDVTNVWTAAADGTELLKRLGALPGRPRTGPEHRGCGRRPAVGAWPWPDVPRCSGREAQDK